MRNVKIHLVYKLFTYQQLLPLEDLVDLVLLNQYKSNICFIKLQKIKTYHNDASIFFLFYFFYKFLTLVTLWSSVT